MRKLIMIALPIMILTFGVAGAVAIVQSRPDPEIRVPEVVPPLVRVQEVRLGDVGLTVASQGTVSPRTESVLGPEVAGRVIRVAPSFAAGGFFEASEVLLTVDPHGYREAVVRAEAEVARAQLHLTRVEAEAEVAMREWRELGARRGSRAPRVWVLTDDRPGNTTQSTGLAAALGWPTEVKRIAHGPLAGLHNRLLGASLLGVDRDRAHRQAVSLREPQKVEQVDHGDAALPHPDHHALAREVVQSELQV